MVIQETERDEKYIKPSVTTDGSFDFDPVDQLMSRDYKQSNIIQLVRTIAPAGSSANQVKITDGTDMLLINSDGSLNFKGLSLLGLNGNKTGSGTTTLGTVPVGKSWRIYGFTLASGNSADLMTLNLGAVASFALPLNTGANSICRDFGNNYIEIPAGATVTLVNTGGGYSTASIQYVEV